MEWALGIYLAADLFTLDTHTDGVCVCVCVCVSVYLKSFWTVWNT